MQKDQPQELRQLLSWSIDRTPIWHYITLTPDYTILLTNLEEFELHCYI